MKSYFDAKREIKKMYSFGLKAIKKQDSKYINFLLSELDRLEDLIQDETVYELDKFGLSILKKDINWVRAKLSMDNKKLKDSTNEKKSRSDL